MKTLNQSLLLALGALVVAGTAYAQVPASNDTSTTDGGNNTGMGTGALGGPAATNGGNQNTAAGYRALQNNTGSGNTAVGASALQLNTSGNNNTASGAGALFENTTGSDNTAMGLAALIRNTSGTDNTASGSEALTSNTTGTQNSAFGYGALGTNVSGGQNVAVGHQALANSTVSGNTAVGWQALSTDTTGGNNTALGSSALAFNQDGTSNVAVGYGALYRNTASNNTAIGWQSLNANTTGAENTASGTSALQSNTTGDNNIAEGYQAGFNLTTGNNNIDIGNVGLAGESNLIRIGTKGVQKGAVIAGISNSPVTGAAVYVTTNGRLGVLASSERYKTAITPMGVNTERLEQLRPVTFHLKTNPHGALQYGLIAEEVAKVYPELVIRDDSGRIDGVRYDELAPMLLNEVQKQRAQMTDEMRDLKQQVAELKALNQATQVALRKLQAKDELVAQR